MDYRGILTRLAIGLALLFGVGSIVLLAVAPLGTLGVSFEWSVFGKLAWDAALSFVFFLQHSGMVRPGYRRRISRWVPPVWHGAIYAIASGAALMLVIFLWQNTEPVMLTLPGPARWVCRAIALCAGMVFLWGVYTVRSTDFFGVRALRASIRGDELPTEPFVISGPYRWVRHPLYSCVLVLLWAEPDATLDNLLLRVLWSAWVVLGAWLEERDLVKILGTQYMEYQGQVPMFVPSRRPWTRR